MSGLTGTQVTGTACGLPVAVEIWVFEQDPFDHYFYLVYDPDTGPAPLAVSDGKFTILDQPIGDPGDDHKRYVIDAVLGLPQCNKAILAKRPDSEANYAFPSLPAGCTVGDSTEILETQP